MSWKGMSDSRPEAEKPKPGKLDRMNGPKSVSYNPTGSEAFGHKRGEKKSSWKGVKDNRP